MVRIVASGVAMSLETNGGMIASKEKLFPVAHFELFVNAGEDEGRLEASCGGVRTAYSSFMSRGNT